MPFFCGGGNILFTAAIYVNTNTEIFQLSMLILNPSTYYSLFFQLNSQQASLFFIQPLAIFTKHNNSNPFIMAKLSKANLIANA